MPDIIETDKLYKSYSVGNREVPVLKGISITVRNGEFVAIMGPSGCGKSSLLYLLGGLDAPTAGSVFFDQSNINKMNDKSKSVMRRRNMGFVFQFYNLVQNLTVVENILLPITMDGKKKKDYEQTLDNILEIVGLTERKNFTPRELSGGQQQRVAIARALIASPKLILADEPIGNLDSQSGTEIMELFRKINQEKGITIVQVTHSQEAAAYSNRIIHMRDGMIEKDSAEDFAAIENLKK
ncbi:putative ABC transport system ATP-binding protein [Virgibacillus halotolerans]|uniref:ABC transporter ATP-binding protein n=1 Tax=Virgibacillus halotolerans TaxID=1071053 RepID=UPI00195F4AE8|nr:ABC transporter ATP-binding protein [Virgibacillus halotolerans]MBM7600366.1 putative ABC transport system ATP-binding protein [Virgibacillus halotolerans]